MSLPKNVSAIEYQIVQSIYELVFEYCTSHLAVLKKSNWNDKKTAALLVANLPNPRKATHWERRCLLEEVRTGNLEWAYGQKVGQDGTEIGEMLTPISMEFHPPAAELRKLKVALFWQYTLLSTR